MPLPGATIAWAMAARSFADMIAPAGLVIGENDKNGAVF
jgi:hypothetical protein